MTHLHPPVDGGSAFSVEIVQVYMMAEQETACLIACLPKFQLQSLQLVRSNDLNISM